MTNLEALANALEDRGWHLSTELAQVAGHRFGAQILLLRKGAHDDRCWDIKAERTDVKGVWRYRLEGFTSSYTPKTPYCPKCGHKLHVEDVRA
jgi:hypothetical protein